MRVGDFRNRPIHGHGLALAAWAIAFALRMVLNPWFPPGFPYLTFFPAVVLVAYFAGLRPAILTAVLSGLTAWWFWIGESGFDWSIATAVALGFYAFVVAVDIFFIDGMMSATRRLRAEVERNAALAQSRDLLLREVQHRVSNNIQVVSALLSVEARSAVDPGARRTLANASARTSLIARIQRSLADADQQTTAFETLARAVADDALKAAGREDVSLEIAGDGVVLSAEEATPVVLIMLECVNNALEHAFPDRSGRIAISLADDGTSRTLLVLDDGVGASEADVAAGGSLGLRIIHALARQLDGEWSLLNADPGCMARLTWVTPASSP